MRRACTSTAVDHDLAADIALRMDGRGRARRLLRHPPFVTVRLRPLHLTEEAGRRALGSEIVEVLVVAERDDLPAVDGADPGAVARDRVVIEDGDGPGAIGLDADAEIVH